MYQFGTDMFMRADLNLSQIETIRGGSASTFASNSPGGVINLISKTGDAEGGAVQATYGLGYGEKRVDGDYGAKISDTLRFHVGGFYRQGEGPRDVGYTAYKGGQIKANITKTFDNGYVRIYGKYLNDHTPNYQFVPIKVSGTNADPTFTSPSTNVKTRAHCCRATSATSRAGRKQQSDPPGCARRPACRRQVGGPGCSVRREGLDHQREVPLLRRGRQQPGHPADRGEPGIRAGRGQWRCRQHANFATGPQAGQAIASPTTLNGNGLLTSSLQFGTKIKSLNNVTNDIRASRVWDITGGELTTTAGFYASSQDYATDLAFLNVLASVAGNGQSTLINTKTAAGVPFTQDGYIAYGIGSTFRRNYDMNYGVNAPYASANYRIGKIAVGGSLRYDMGKVRGTLYGAELGGGRPATTSFDMNRDGAISTAETKVSLLPLGRPGDVDYDYHYLSYSTGVNYRVAEQLAVFGRYSRGGRASADKILFTPAVNYSTGKLVDDESAYDTVKQIELGLKYRIAGLTFNATGFSAKTGERNVQIVSGADGQAQVNNIVRGYEAKGVELEAAVRRGPFSVTAGGTYTDAKIASDALRPELVGNKPRHQADFIYSVTPQVELKYVTIGANVIGTTSSYAQDTNQLKLPGYKLVNAFVQVRPAERVQLMLNVNNLFNKLALIDSEQATIPASGVVLGRAFLGRTASATLRYSF